MFWLKSLYIQVDKWDNGQMNERQMPNTFLEAAWLCTSGLMTLCQEIICSRQEIICGCLEIICGRQEIICGRQEIICDHQEIICSC